MREARASYAPLLRLWPRLQLALLPEAELGLPDETYWALLLDIYRMCWL